MDLKDVLTSGANSTDNINGLSNTIAQTSMGISGFSTQSIIVGFIVGVIGLAYFGYGKKNEHYSALISGLIMLVFPYFVYDLKYTIIITIISCILPFFVKF